VGDDFISLLQVPLFFIIFVWMETYSVCFNMNHVMQEGSCMSFDCLKLCTVGAQFVALCSFSVSDLVSSSM